MRRQQIFAALLTSVLCIGCGGPSSTPSNTGQDAAITSADPVLKLLYWQAPTILNPHLSSGFKDAEASRITLEPLASFDAEGNWVLFLADEVPTLENGGLSADGKSVTWKLKTDVQWSDGTPFTAQDVAFTYELIANPDVAALTAGTYEVNITDYYGLN